jgi:hypothetical protein
MDFNELEQLPRSAKCVSEPHVFVVLSGLFAGALRGWRVVAANGAIVTFPLVHLSGVTWLHLRFRALVTEAFQSAWHSLKWFCLLYALAGK